MSNYYDKYLKYKKKYTDLLKKQKKIKITKLVGGGYQITLFHPNNIENQNPIVCNFEIADLNEIKKCLLENLNAIGLTDEEKRKFDIYYFDISNVDIILIHNGKIIETNEYIEKVCQESCKIVYLLRKKNNVISIQINPIMGNSFNISIEDDELIFNLKSAIIQEKGYENIILTYNNIKLEDQKRLKDYNIKNNSVLRLTVNMNTRTFETKSYGTLNRPDRTYEGELSEGVPHGEGKEYFKGQKIYEGNFVNGDREGYGEEYYEGKLIYQGKFRNGVRNGKGIYISLDGSTYKGDFENDKIHGKGIYFYYDGSFYEGDFKDNLRHGKGTFTYSDGHETFTYPDGYTYEGDWIDDEIVKGIQFDNNSERIYEGDFKRGRRYGKGKLYNDELSYIEGDFLGDLELPYGKGKEYTDRKLLYEGDFINGIREGKGKIYFNNNSYYIGSFYRNMPHGIGKIYKNDVLQEEGFNINGYSLSEYNNFKEDKGIGESFIQNEELMNAINDLIGYLYWSRNTIFPKIHQERVADIIITPSYEEQEKQYFDSWKELTVKSENLFPGVEDLDDLSLSNLITLLENFGELVDNSNISFKDELSLILDALKENHLIIDYNFNIGMNYWVINFTMKEGVNIEGLQQAIDKFNKNPGLLDVEFRKMIILKNNYLNN